MKVDANGTGLVWATGVPFGTHGRSGAVDGALTPDGGVAIVGWINEQSIYDPSKIFVAKYTGEGHHQWHQVFETDADYAFGAGVLSLDDGSVLVLGNECNYNSGGYGCRTTLLKIGPDLGPMAAFDMDVREGGVPLTVQFNDLTSGGAAPYTYAWDFDDDGTVDSMEQNPVHTYDDRGTYSVRLAVTDGNGLTDSFVCEECLLAYYTGIYTGAAGVEIVSFSVTDDADAEPETYDFQLAPEGLDEGGAFGFTLDATGPDGSHAFRITFPSPYDPSMTLYKLPDWDVIPYTVIDAYTIEVVLDIVDGELDPVFVLAATLPLKSLIISVEGSGTTDPAPGTTSYFVDDTLTVMVTAIPEACWSLDQWSGAVTGSDNPISVELNKYSGDTSVTAHFVASALIGVDDDCDGDVDGSDLAALVAQGAAITPEDVAALASLFGEIE
jgi:PKD repeat protein